MESPKAERNDDDRGNPPVLWPPCECIECSQQYRNGRAQLWHNNNYAGSPSDSDARDLLTTHVTHIRKDQEYLRDALFKHGNTIVSRWKKKSISKRADCLVKALPTLEARRWAILDYHYQIPASKKMEDVRNAYLLPYLSLDDLKMDPMRLLSLLHYRAKYSLDEWMLFDMKQTKTGWERGRLSAMYSIRCVVMHGTRYGELVDWDEAPAHRWDIVGYPRAQIIIEAQHLLFKFLRDVVGDLLKDVHIESSSTKLVELSLAGFRRSQEDEMWSAFSNQAYSAPPTFNVDRLTDIARTRLADAQDRLWLLQTDPSYVQSAIAYHRTSLIGNVILREGSGKKLYSLITHCLTYSPAKRVHDWHHVVEECENLSKVQQRFRDNIHTGNALPRKYNEAVNCLELLLRNVLLMRIQELQVLLPQLRGFEQSFGRPHMDGTGQGLAIPIMNRDTQESFATDPLLWCLWQMTMNDEYAHMMTDPALLFGFFEDLVANPAVHSVDIDRVEQRLLDELSEFGAVWELLAAVRYHRPVRRQIEKEEALSLAPPRSFWRQWANEDRSGPGALSKKDHEVALAQKLDTMRMPSGRKDLAWLARATEVRQVLKEFWDHTRSGQRYYLESIYTSEEDIETLLSLVSFDLAPDYQAALQEEQDAILKRHQAGKKAKALDNAKETYLDPSTSYTAAPALTIRTKMKVKTRADIDSPAKAKGSTSDTGIPHNTGFTANTTVTPSKDGPSAVTEVHPTLTVRPNSLKIFQGMYPTDTDTPSGAAIDWRKFVGAMTDAGFQATQSSGSAVTFSNGHGRIIFHKPHPVAKVDPVMLATFGKRMKKWFHWRREIFVAADAGEQGNDAAGLGKGAE
jgi:hypothetical protein